MAGSSSAIVGILRVLLTGSTADFESGMKRSGREVRNFQTQMLAASRTIATTFGVGLSVGALTSFVKNLTDAASETVDLSNKLGISTEAVQRLKYVAGQTGATIDQFGNAIFKLGTNLAGGGKPVVSAVEQLGLSFAELRRLSPEKQFDTIAAALERVESPQTRNRIAVELFGKAAKEILPAIAEGYSKLAAEATVASDAQIRALDKAGDALDRAKQKFSAMATRGIGGIVLAAEEAEPKVNALADAINRGFLQQSGVFGWIARYNEGLRQTAAAADSAADALNRLKAQTPKVATQPGLGPAADFEAGLGISQGLEAQAKAGRAAEEQWAKNLAEANKQDAAYNKLIATHERYDVLMRITGELLRDVSRTSITGAGAQSALNAAFDAGVISVNANIAALKDWREQVSLLGVKGGAATDLIPELTGPIPVGPRKLPGVMEQMFGSAAAFGQSITQSILGAIQGGGNVGQAAGGAIGSSILGGVAKKLTTAVGDTAATVTGWMGGALNAAFPILGSLMGSFGGKLIEKLVGAFDRDKGRDVVEAFAKSLGGFDALHGKLGALGAEGEQLWIRLTQGVGRNNPQQAQAAVDAVTAALDRQDKQLAETKTKVGELVQIHLGAGQTIPAAMQASIDKLVEMKVLTVDNAAEMLALTKDAGPGFDEVKAAADRLGIGLDGIGGKIANLAFAEKVTEASSAFETLEAAGADMTEVFKQSVEKIQPLVTEAIKFGKDMPDAMRPYLEKMVEAGLLTDENGVKLTDLSKLQFAEPLSKKFDDLILKLGELVDAIKTDVGGAFDDLGRKVVHPTIAPRYVVPTGGEADVGEGLAPDFNAPPGFARGTAGEYVDFGPGTLAVLHGREKITPFGSERAGGPVFITVVSQLDGREVARNQVKYIPSQLGLAGVS